MISTIETRLKLDTKQELIVNSCLILWSIYYCKTWIMFNNQHLEEKIIWHQLIKSNLLIINQVNSLMKVRLNGMM